MRCKQSTVNVNVPANVVGMSSINGGTVGTCAVRCVRTYFSEPAWTCNWG